MALIHCSECLREISDRATACPGCGAPLDTTMQSQAVSPTAAPASLVMGVAALALGVAGIVMPYFATVFLVPAAFVCGIVAFRRGQRGLGGAGIVLAALG